MKITDKTTLIELAIERARLGIEEMHIHFTQNGARTCSVFGQGRGCQHAGKTEAEAIDRAFRAFEADAVDAVLASYIPSGQHKVVLNPSEDPLGPMTATIVGGEHAGKTVQIPAPKISDHMYLSAGDNPYADGDVAYRGCTICGLSRTEHRK